MSASDDGVREGPAQPTRERVCPYTDVGPSLSPLRVAHLGSEPARGREKVTDDRGDVGIGDVYRQLGSDTSRSLRNRRYAIRHWPSCLMRRSWYSPEPRIL